VTKLSINLNKFALLRNSRGGKQPVVLDIAERCLAGGADGITVHPRPDQRHARYSDVSDLVPLLSHWAPAELNLEGAPAERFLEVVEKARPHQCTLVPDAPNQLTSDHGWDVLGDGARIEPVIARLRSQGIRVSLFLDPDLAQVAAAAKVGTDRIELYTAPYAEAFGTSAQASVLASYREAARLAQSLGLGVNAGHDLSLLNLGAFLSEVPDVLEVSIGHAFICESLDYTLEGTLERYLAIIRS
jgi:pyridoxine 5-phosphate synthase